MLVSAAVAAIAVAPTAVLAQAAVTQERPVVVAPDPGLASVINPTGRDVVLTSPVNDGGAYLGDATVTLAADGTATFSARRLLDLLAPRVSAETLQPLSAALERAGRLTRGDLEGASIAIRYDPQTLGIELEIASAARASRAVDLGDGGSAAPATYVAPAGFSAYLNLRGSLDWVQQGPDSGLAAPVTFIDGAARLGGIVLESEANWSPGGTGVDFQRRGSRLVYDDRDRLVRWTAGDLQTLGRGFQSSPEIAGLSVVRFYSVLEPQTIIRPRGRRSFLLDRRSIVEVRINDQLVRRLELEPGSYDLRDFPFTQGSNDVRLTITDDSGRTETVSFDIFLDQAQLAEGLSEFGLYAGVLAPTGLSGPAYSDDFAISGFYRRGISDRLTLGGNVQADARGWMGGVEAVVATPFGAFAGFASLSRVDGIGSGWAGLATFQRTIQRGGNRADALSLSVELRSRNFAPVGTPDPFNPYAFVLGASYNSAISDAVYAGLDARYSRGRDGEPDVRSLRGSVGWRISPALNFTGDATWERDSRGERLAFFLSLTYRLDRRSSVRADYDSRFDRTRLSYQTYRGSGVGAYNVSADVERSDLGTGLSVNANYFGNRADLGFSHFGTLENDLGRSTGQRSSLRFGTSLAFADGAVSVGRPIYDSFAIVERHRSMRGAEILVDPDGRSATAMTGLLGTAVHPALSSYSERTILVSAPEAPLTADLGQGAFRLLPPYRGGYRLTVGSDYAISVVGRLLRADGSPVSLVTGTAIEVANPEREPTVLFTNAEGRFAATGLAPGRWRIRMNDAEASTVEFDIPEIEGTHRLGELTAFSAGPPPAARNP